MVDGISLHDVRTDQHTWEQILKKVLAGKMHPGIMVDRLGFEAVMKDVANRAPVYVLEERGKDIASIDLADSAVFILGDHVGLPKRAEDFALRFGQKVSLGRQPYLAASCITILNYLLDSKGKH
jgi:tRNA pseudouridine-54 N-methylase